MRGCGFRNVNKYLKDMATWEKEHAGHEEKEIPISEAPTYYIIERRCVPCGKGIVTSKIKEKKSGV